VMRHERRTEVGEYQRRCSGVSITPSRIDRVAQSIRVDQAGSADGTNLGWLFVETPMPASPERLNRLAAGVGRLRQLLLTINDKGPWQTSRSVLALRRCRQAFFGPNNNIDG
jgi:hypothetical protein